MKLHKLMDFNRAFYSYDTLDGANCQTVFWEKMTQKEAAVQAVKKIGLNYLLSVNNVQVIDAKNVKKILILNVIYWRHII